MIRYGAAVELNQGWVGSDLGDYRESAATYRGYPVDSLPPLPEERFDGSFHWLAEVPIVDPETSDIEYDIEIEYMTPIEAGPTLRALGPGLPASFTAFMSRPELLAAVPSCTACWWDLSTAPVPSPLGDGARLVRFLNDQQGCVFWYLYLLPDGGHRIACGTYQYDADEPVGAAEAAADLVQVAPDFEHFVYRFWVENVAWFELVGANLDWDELSPPVRDYLRPYRSARRSRIATTP
ncbi:hypothetical protein ACFP2T_22245 [Plantactinospora solaniradicis]|uniref:Uncharacterized protein n=1 Tax=Plantactinospora solaniradicis TaxID=1723736 RepID=A0ABW1KBL0_9ACTN